ncbi:glyoxalase [Streptomyces badius]
MHFTDPDGNGWAVQEYRRRETEPWHKLLADQAAGNGSNAGDTVG